MAVSNPPNHELGHTLAMLTLRIWLGVRAIQTGIEKYAGTTSHNQDVLIDGAPNAYGLTETATGKVYALSNYHGVPAPLYDQFSNQPLIPAWGLNLFDSILGPALIIVGLGVLLGIGQRISLFAMGLIYTSLSFGLILIKQDAGIAWLGVHIVMIVMALVLSPHNRFAVLKKW